MTEYLRSQFDLSNPDLVAVLDELPLWSAPFGLRLLDLVQYKKNLRVLDIGYGMGFPIVELAMRLGPSARVFGLDPWQAGVDRTSAKLKLAGLHTVELIEGHAEHMPFDDGSFDLIVSNNGLNNVADLSTTLAECRRVSRKDAQLVFTFNTEDSFPEFYSLYRDVLRRNNLRQFEPAIDAHIYTKRKPVAEFERLLAGAGFEIRNCVHDQFRYRFTDGTALLNHFFIRLAFLEPWKDILPEDLQPAVFHQIEEGLNRSAEESQGLTLTVPFTALDCRRGSAALKQG